MKAPGVGRLDTRHLRAGYLELGDLYFSQPANKLLLALLSHELCFCLVKGCVAQYQRLEQLHLASRVWDALEQPKI